MSSRSCPVQLRPLKTEMLKGASRLHVSQELLLELTRSAESGKPCTIERSGDPASRREAVLFKSAEPNLGKKVALIPRPFQDACGFTYSDQHTITYTPGSTLPEAQEIVLEDAGSDSAINALTEQAWIYAVEDQFCNIQTIFSGMTLKDVGSRGAKKTFAVKLVDGKTNGNAQFVLGTTVVRFHRPGAEKLPRGDLHLAPIEGMAGPVRELNDFLLRFKYAPFPQAVTTCGIVIHGGHGVGKTMLLNRIAATGWGTVLPIAFSDKLTSIQETFQRAREQQPSIVTIDRFDRLVDKDRSNRQAVIQALCSFLDKLSAGPERNEALPKVAVLVTCQDYAADIPSDLREPGRLTNDVFLPLPDVDCRRTIVKSFDVPFEPSIKADAVDYVAERTHAYNGTDLSRLVTRAMEISKVRHCRAAPAPSAPPADPAWTADEQQQQHGGGDTTTPEHHVSYADVNEALVHIRPSAMHDVNLKPPPIQWSDIGGQDAAKESLRLSVLMLNERPEVLRLFVSRPPRGILLYGPPGCSKTMAAQAMATESGLNFFAVKGAELLNQYVGESERAIRRLFARARAAPPAMIFFDEIDSICGQRQGMGGGGGGGSSSTSTSHGSLNVLTTMLNEMDGFEAMKQVVVLAATNRPQVLDPALLRPGRFDRLIYISPPDRAARETIFRNEIVRQGRGAEGAEGGQGGVDPAALADRTEGFSGAEISGICRSAGAEAYKRYKLRGGAQGITMDDLERAIREMPKMITQAMLDGFKQWEDKFAHF
ncbi:uncharacterized protein E0L32_006561 [Thyridium curvatum]|uniref:AAA+ ATPase domain-containing protein n=1 Tax=Thyridium curvatum TaxID=1093900 RepID=A0A507AQJ8_9PEZI|nr:uncharacterized protein E0L32_006561 [Thyridium curvatum]TPX13135.1 hypothetical protein E0L32_006561 [Thyridium curvatum]